MPTPSRTQRGGFSLCVTPAHRHTVRRRGERGQMHQSLNRFGGMYNPQNEMLRKNKTKCLVA